MAEEMQTLAQRQANICEVFSSTKRIMILWALADRELSVGEIASAIDSSMQNTSKHLRLMKDKGILASRREANFIYYQIVPNELMKRCRLLQQAPRAPAFPQPQNDPVTESSPTEIE